jgi:hypothetical protein
MAIHPTAFLSVMLGELSLEGAGIAGIAITTYWIIMIGLPIAGRQSEFAPRNLAEINNLLHFRTVTWVTFFFCYFTYY